MAGTDLTRTKTPGGIAADHPALEPAPLLAAPTTAGEFNTVGERLIPKGCFRMEDVRFEFDSSFIKPEAAEEMPLLADLIEKHSEETDDDPPQKVPPPLSIFGHADPVGKDDYNKQLSGRRATAVYAMLVRDVELWEELFSKPFGGDDWGNKAIRTMLSAVGHLPEGDGQAAVKSFQEEKGLKADGVVGPKTRKALYRAYMDFLCGPRLELDKEKNFLARNQDSEGKGDRQGCGEFNPVLIFSKEEQAKFEKEKDKTERDNENAPNRRVMILLFAPGRRVKPEIWPCPRVKEGVAGCKSRFFPDGEKRRSPQEKQRKFEDTKDTFACRFYQVITDDSPCEKTPKKESARFCCKHRGVVVDNVDPLQIGRLRVNVPSVLETEELFAQPAVPYAGPDTGFFFLPPVGANVWVEFEGGDKERPIWSGCFWGAGELPDEADFPEKKVLKTESFILVIDDRASGGSCTLKVGQMRFVFENQTVEIDNGLGAIVRLAGPKVSVNNDILEVI
ncbi:MAG: phage baseplate assembly protein V [Candidatus Zixiibacteriota bacterium]